MQVREAARIEPFLDAGDTLVVDIDVADEMGDLRAVWIDALVLGQKSDARKAEPVDLLALLGRDLALEPHEAALGSEPLAQLRRIDLRHDRGEEFRCFVDVDDAVRLRKQGGRAHVGSQNFPVAVEDIGTRGRHRIGPHGAAGAMTVGHRRKYHEPGRNDRITDGKDENSKPDPRARLDGAVDVAAIEQRVHQPPAPRVARGRRRICYGRIHHGHLLAAGTLPVGWRSRTSGLAITVPIGSGSSTGTRSAGRSGRLSSLSI